MRANFDKCLAHILKSEGGFTNNPKDRGNWTGGAQGSGTLKGTNMGIAAHSYPNEDIRNMTVKRAGEIYRRDFWAPVRGDDLPAGMDLVAFDAAVNSGVSRGARWLQQAIGVRDDGKIGPATLSRAHEVDHAAAINKACDIRLSFLRGLKTWGTFGRGWTARVADVRATALSMAQRPSQSIPVTDSSPATPGPSGTTKGAIYLIIAAVAAAAVFLGVK